MVLAVVVLGRQRRRLLTEKKTSRRRQLRPKKNSSPSTLVDFCVTQPTETYRTSDEISKMHQFYF